MFFTIINSVALTVFCMWPGYRCGRISPDFVSWIEIAGLNGVNIIYLFPRIFVKWLYTSNLGIKSPYGSHPW